MDLPVGGKCFCGFSIIHADSVLRAPEDGRGLGQGGEEFGQPPGSPEAEFQDTRVGADTKEARRNRRRQGLHTHTEVCLCVEAGEEFPDTRQNERIEFIRVGDTVTAAGRL